MLRYDNKHTVQQELVAAFLIRLGDARIRRRSFILPFLGNFAAVRLFGHFGKPSRNQPWLSIGGCAAIASTQQMEFASDMHWRARREPTGRPPGETRFLPDSLPRSLASWRSWPTRLRLVVGQRKGLGGRIQIGNVGTPAVRMKKEEEEAFSQGVAVLSRHPSSTAKGI
ncbi:hypothetical protein LZ31DRAFT_144531 [Colletotrichum somersetense]|nr:hypothetical protein LZ31DRAFT_144531 [Colletotrichum somersetense]